MNPAEVILFHSRSWIKAKDLAAACDLSERDLRGDESPIRKCAISGDRGYKHVRCATQLEIEHYINRLRRHGIEELKHAQAIRRIRNESGVNQSELFAAA